MKLVTVTKGKWAEVYLTIFKFFKLMSAFFGRVGVMTFQRSTENKE